MSIIDEITNTSITWGCACGARTFNHRQRCDRCFGPKPPPAVSNANAGVTLPKPGDPKPAERDNDPGHYGYYG